MRSVLLASALAVLGFAVPAHAVMPATLLDQPLGCFSSSDGKFTLQAYLALDSDRVGAPAGYRYGKDYLEDKQVGTWGEEGDGAGFADGPLAGSRLTVAPDGTRMPGDQVEGRTWPLLLDDGKGASTSYCRSIRIDPRSELRFDVPWVERRSGMEVKLPKAIDPQSLYFDLDENPYTTARARVRVAKPNLWRLELLGGPCSGSNCPTQAIFSAKRAKRSELEVRFNRKLARGARGWVGSVGCAFGSGVGWGPVYCGQTIIVWHHNGINYCIESRTTSDKGLVRLANQALRDPS